ncbi:MAG: hypothetical protein ACI845_001400 [Gammaproteobacteria bacterium]|jgi:hypothetical protein
MNSRKTGRRYRQLGVSAPSWLVIASIFGFLLITFFKVFPMYYENYQLGAALNSVQQDQSVDPKSKKALWESLKKNMFVQEVRSIGRENVEITRKDGVTTITIQYETKDDYVGNLTIGAKFTETIQIQR